MVEGEASGPSSDADNEKIQELQRVISRPEWQLAGVEVLTDAFRFQDALERHKSILQNPRAVKLLIIDQYGVDAVTAEVFKRIISFPRTDFIFFLSSSTLNRFRDHDAISIKIDRPENSYDIHRAAFDWYQKMAPPWVFLGRFSIKKGSNIYGLVFGTQHPLGAHKFLEVAWRNDEIAGEANFDIERENIAPGELMLPLAEFRPRKIQAFEAELEAALRKGNLKSEADLVHFCIAAGMTCRHAKPVLNKLKAEGLIECEFHTPNIKKLRQARLIRLRP